MSRSKLFALSVFALSIALPHQAQAWTKSFVVDWFEPAFYFGAEEGDSVPGTDCPAGAVPQMDWRKELKTSWRTDAEVDDILNPEDPKRPQFGGFRGPDPEKDVYRWPWLVADRGLQPVTGPDAYGFDLDANPATGFSVGHDHSDRTGIDNEYYRAWGCLMAWRGPTKLGHHQKYVMDGMRDGSFTVLMVLSGEGDHWANDKDAKLAFYMSKDKMVKDAAGEIAPDYSFRIRPAPGWQSVVPVTLTDGVVETKSATDFTLSGIDAFPLDFRDGQIRFEIGKDGHLTGLAGGYRDARAVYHEFAVGGAIYELTMHLNTPQIWYATHRYADGHPDPETGKFTTISTAYRFYGTPAFVVDPDGKDFVTEAKIYPGDDGHPRRRRGFRSRTPGPTEAEIAEAELAIKNVNQSEPQKEAALGTFVSQQ